MPRAIRLDHSGIAEVLKSGEVSAAIDSLARATADALRSDPSIVKHSAPVVVDRYETDRTAAAVTIAHAGGRGIQAKHGSLTRAAGSVGLEVRSHE